MEEEAKKTKERKIKINPKILFFLTFITAVLIITSTYAWLSATLNVKIQFFEMSVDSDSGLYISLDGIEFGESVLISMDTIITDLNDKYPNHTNRWGTRGLWPVSIAGVNNPNKDKYDVFKAEFIRIVKPGTDELVRRLLIPSIDPENASSRFSSFLAFDVFLKNISYSPKSDNLFISPETFIDYDEHVTDEEKENMDGIMNSLRIGIIKIGSVSHESTVDTIQNIPCNNNCTSVIYEPNSTEHSVKSIEDAKKYNITLTDGIYAPTFAVYKEGWRLQHTNGHLGTGIPLDTEHFVLQNTISDLTRPVFEIPNGITKLRIYIWIEGQDVDSLETRSAGADINAYIGLEKDTAGYE